MHVLKTIGLVLLVLIGIALIAALFIKKEISGYREVTINKPAPQVFDYVKYLKNQNQYSKWAAMDSATAWDFRGTDGTKGFVTAWESNNKSVGKGEQEIIGIEEGKRLDYELRFTKPMENTMTAFMTTEAVGATQTKVKWGFDGKMKYPFNFMRLFVNMDKLIGDDFGTGLTNLKTKLETQP